VKTKPFGPTGLPLPVVGQGTWMMEGADRSGALAALRRGLDLGMTHVDTAEMYGAGRVEELVGEALVGRRDSVYLVSKVLPQNAGFADTQKACERSLSRLRTDRLDLYLLHWPASVPIEETVRAFQKLKKSGKIRAFGVSNFDVPKMEAAVRAAGPGEIACNQVLYHLEERTIEHALLRWCQEREISVVAYSPLGQGNFPPATSAGGRLLRELARSAGTSPYTLALAYLIREKSVFAIPKSAEIPHLEENARAAELPLSAEMIEKIGNAFPPGPWRGLATA
jgi:diketogulonate reductase-like aldo/keto reductase